jgi:hypothetical protein
MWNSWKQLQEEFVVYVGLYEYICKDVKIRIAGWFNLKRHCGGQEAECAFDVKCVPLGCEVTIGHSSTPYISFYVG